MSVSRSDRLLERAEAALVSAIEAYNKPDARYRDEAFAILALNAWELLLKAQLLRLGANDPRVLYDYERRRTRTGDWSSRTYLRMNRTGNVRTVSIAEAINRLVDRGTSVHDAVRGNIDLLTAVRDNSIHFVAGPDLSRMVLEVGTAAIRNFVELEKRWFSRDLSRYALYLMPIGFLATPHASAVISGEEQNVISYLARRSAELAETHDGADLHVMLHVDISMRRVTDASASVALTRNAAEADAVVQLAEEDIRRQYPWDYNGLLDRLRPRYLDFKTNSKFHAIRRPLMADPRFVATRLLDPGNPRSVKKDFYNPNILTQFDAHYVLVPG